VLVIPIEFAVDAARVQPHLSSRHVAVPADVEQRLRSACAAVTTDPAALAEASRDWWPLAMTWALAGEVGGLAGAVARPATVGEVVDVLRIAQDALVPVTAAAGRSGVSGGSVPIHGGIVLDLGALDGIVDLDDASMVLDVRAGTFGDELEDSLRTDHAATLGHWPQSMALSTVGGWLACRSAGQLSNRYGKIEDMVLGLDVVLADGTVVHTGGAPRAAVGPDLNQVFVGSEGTLGVITGARLRVHPAPRATRTDAYAIERFGDGLDACRRIVQRGATPAVLRLYDEIESQRNFDLGSCVLLVLDEGDDAIVDAAMTIVAEECASFGALDASLVDRWLAHRNDVSVLAPMIRSGLVVDTFEIAARWRDLAAVTDAVLAAVRGVDGTLAVSVHQSHAYTTGACCYFTFGGQPPPNERERYYHAVYDMGMGTALARGAALSHHHGVGLNRARFVRDALGPAFNVLAALKSALDPRGILNPGKLGLPDPFE
jgi:alkyldihydroxyacetonephosphate synthase